MIFPLAILFLATSNVVRSEREHKVHNIVLYPERHSWCQTTPIKQIVAMPGYEPVTIDNNVCVGACYSYSIPKTQPAEPGELIGPYCDSCQPLEIQCYHVTLTADDGSKTIQKRVQIITNCSCSSCNKEQAGDCEISEQNTLELPFNLFSNHAQAHKNNTETPSEPEIPELLHLPHERESTAAPESAAHDQQHFKINANLINLLRSIQDQEDDEDESNFNYDRDQLKELLKIIEGSRHELSDQNLMKFVNFVNVHNSENLELDLSKLKEVLMNFKKDQKSLMERHRKFSLGINLEELGERNNEDINRDIDDLLKKNAVPKKFGIEGNHLGLGHHKGSHIGMGLQLTSNLDSHKLENKQKPDTKTSPNLIDDNNQKKTEIEGGKGHHHLGETQHIGLKLGHLVHGPHGSLVIAPDGIKVEEKLNLESEDVSPNHEGVVLSYENHRVHHKRQTPADFI